MKPSPVRGYLELVDMAWLTKLEPDMEFVEHNYLCECSRCRDCLPDIGTVQLPPLEPRTALPPAYGAPTGYGGEDDLRATLDAQRKPDACDEPPSYCDGWQDGSEWGQREAFWQGACAASVVWIFIVVALAEWL